MTYQVSYCIYTAATVETEELKRASTQKEREDAAARLAAAFRILQQEASHTPGSGRSLDTIRRLLSTGPPRATNLGSHPGNNQGPAMGQSGQSHHTNQNQLTASYGRNHGQRPEATNGHGRHLLSSAVQSAPYNNNGGGSNNSSHQRPAPGANSAIDDSCFFSMDVGAWNDEFSFGGTDTGAGFHPDAFPWGVAGPILRNAGGSSLNGMVWPPTSHAEGLQ